ncbi:MAG: hypothetical protein ACK51K_07725 [Gammaproteobacteria bacterium]|jgi:hypothetical protein
MRRNTRKPEIATAKGTAECLRLFHEASARQAERDKRFAGITSVDREWTREELYQRGEPDCGHHG